MTLVVLFCASICLSYAGYWLGLSLEPRGIKWLSILASLVPGVCATVVVVFTIDKKTRKKEDLEKNRIRLVKRRAVSPDYALRYGIFTGVLSCSGAVIFAWVKAGLLVAVGIFVIAVFTVLFLFGLTREIVMGRTN